MTNTLLFRDPGKNKQVIPGAVMGMAGLEQAECLRIHNFLTKSFELSNN